MYVHDQEALKLSIVCMRTGFTQAHELLWVTCLILLVSLCFSVCLFVLRRWDLWGSAMPAFSCQYLDKDELLHLAGANKDHIYIILILHIYIVRPFRNAALFIFVQFSCWPRWSECFAWQVFSTQGVASRIRALPAVFGAFWAHISFKIIKVSMKLLNRGLFVTAHGPPTCLGDNLPKLWTGMWPGCRMLTGICTSMQLFASRLAWFQVGSKRNHAVFGRVNPWDALDEVHVDFENARTWRNNRNISKSSNHLESPWRGLAQKSPGSWFEGPPVENSESIECSVLDALDEVQLYWKCFPAETA